MKFYTKNGRKIPITPKKVRDVSSDIFGSGKIEHRFKKAENLDEVESNIDPDELEEFARDKANSIENELAPIFENIPPTIVTILKTAVTAIAHADPNFATAYILYLSAREGYYVIKKIIENHQNGDSPYNAILNAVTSEIKEKIYSHITTKSLEAVIDIITDESLTKFGRIGKTESITPTKTELEQRLLQIYFKNLLESELTKNETWYMESALGVVSEKLTDLLISENVLFENSSSILTGAFDAKTWLRARISTINCN